MSAVIVLLCLLGLVIAIPIGFAIKSIGGNLQGPGYFDNREAE